MRFRYYPKSLTGQLILLLLVTVLVAQSLALFVFAENRRAAINTAVREQIFGRTAALIRLVEDTPPDLHQRLVDAAGSSRLLYSITPEPLVDRTALPQNAADSLAVLNQIFGDGRDIRIDLVDAGPHDDHDMDEKRGPLGRRAEHRLDRHDLRDATIVLSARLASGEWLNAETVLPPPPPIAAQTMLSTLLIAASMTVIIILTMRRIARPLGDLAGAADRLGRGETVGQLSEEGPDEIRRTTRAFNAMQDRVQRFVSDRTRMLAAISHDLRTPLTSLRLRAEFIDDEEIRDKIIDTVDEMTRMTTATLSFAKDDASQEASVSTDIAGLLRKLAADYTDAGKAVTMTGPDKLDLMLRPTAIRRAIANLVDNACRYGTSARITLAEVGNDTVISIEDDGPGIPLDRLADVFEPFVRLEESRSEETGGVGLGLSIARSIVRAHGGELALANRVGGSGLIATITLPRAL